MPPSTSIEGLAKHVTLAQKKQESHLQLLKKEAQCNFRLLFSFQVLHIGGAGADLQMSGIHPPPGALQGSTNEVGESPTLSSNEGKLVGSFALG